MFTNPVVGGTTLIRPAIQSPNFVHLSSGWTINQDGSAEFNNVAIRGTLTVTGPSTLGGTLTMSGGACILTAASPNQRISICSTPANAISFFSGDATETSPGTLQVLASGGSGQLSLQAPKFSGTGTNAGTLLLGNDGTWTLIGPGSTQFSSTVFNELSGTQLRLLVGNASLGQSVPHGTSFAEFRNSFSNAAGTYCLLQQNNGTTYLNAAAGQNLNFRINNGDCMQLQSSRAFTGPWNFAGTFSTFLECRGGNVLAGSGINPNYEMQAADIVVNFVGGNSNFTFVAPFSGALYAVVVSEGGGLANTVVGTQGYASNATGIYAVAGNTGAGINGLVRINYFALGS